MWKNLIENPLRGAFVNNGLAKTVLQELFLDPRKYLVDFEHAHDFTYHPIQYGTPPSDRASHCYNGLNLG